MSATDDLALAVACLDVETTVRALQTITVERLHGMLPQVDGDPGDRVLARRVRPTHAVVDHSPRLLERLDAFA